MSDRPMKTVQIAGSTLDSSVPLPFSCFRVYDSEAKPGYTFDLYEDPKPEMAEDVLPEVPYDAE